MAQQARTFEAEMAQTVRLPYLLHLPADYDPEVGGRWPLIFFLHGAGERGEDLEQIKVHGIPRVAEARPDFPFVAVSPQCPVNRWWSDFLLPLRLLLDEVMRLYAVDPDRVYLTGLSMGGYGTWHLATEYPDRFAAIAPICGGGHWAYGFPERVCALKEVPVWAFHGARDDTVPLSEAEGLVRELKRCGGDVRLTVYPRVKHDSWTRTYDNPELYAWFLSHMRGQRAPAAG